MCERLRFAFYLFFKQTCSSPLWSIPLSRSVMADCRVDLSSPPISPSAAAVKGENFAQCDGSIHTWARWWAAGGG